MNPVKVAVVKAQGPLSAQFLVEERLPDTLHPTLSLDGAVAYFVDDLDTEIFIAAYDVHRNEVLEYIHLRVPEPISYPSVHVDDRSLWIASATGAVIQLSLGTYEVARWCSAREFKAPNFAVTHGLVVPGSLYLWLGDDNGTSRIVDLSTGASCQQPGAGSYAQPVLRYPTSNVWLSLLRRADAIFEANGTEVVKIDDGDSVVRRPDDDGWVSTTISEDDRQLKLVLRDELGEVLDAALIPGSHWELAHVLASSVDPPCLWVLFQEGSTKAPYLAAFQIEKKGLRRRKHLRLVYNVRVPWNSALIQDSHGRRAVLASPSQRGVTTRWLGLTPPDFDFGLEQSIEPPRFRLNYYCGRDPLDKKIESLASRICYKSSDQERQAAIEQFLREHAGDPQSCLSLSDAVRARLKSREADAIIEAVCENHPGNVLTEFYEAEIFLREGEWEGALTHLNRVSKESLQPHRRCHLHHLRGLALFYLGQVLEASEEFGRALGVDGDPCRVRPFMAAANGLIQGRSSEAEHDWVVEFVARCRRADNLLAIGDAAEAWEVLDHFNVWRMEDAQGGARLALAALRHPSSDPALAFRRRHALARYRHYRQQRYRNYLVLSSIHWPPEQLAEVDASAEAYLGEATA